ncbi:MAG: 3-deoxy-8-phosphooctulonate synthase [Chthoniobacterales bacterium]
MKPKPLRIGPLRIDDKRLTLILGPCVIESEAFVRRMAKKLHKMCSAQKIPFIFKASYDKANRSSVRSFRGPGIQDGCRILAEIGKEYGIPVTTDVHTPQEAEIAAEWIDLLQIPAFLCRQTDLIKTCAQTGRAVNVKKGQFLAPWDVKNIAEKLDHYGCRNYLFTERGTTFGYNNLVADMRSIYWMQELGYHVIFDATHSVQRPGGGGDKTTGDGALAPVLAKAAVATGCNVVFMETHENPAKALSDGPNQIPLSHMPSLLRILNRIHEARR